MTNVHQRCEMYFHIFVPCFFDHFARFHAEIFSCFLHSLSTASFAAGIFIAWGIGINLCTNCICAVICHLSLQYGPREFLAQCLPYAVSWIHLLPVYMLIWICYHPLGHKLRRSDSLSFYKAQQERSVLPLSSVHS